MKVKGGIRIPEKGGKEEKNFREEKRGGGV